MAAIGGRTRLAAAATAVLLAAGCDSGTSVGTGQLTVKLIDAPMASVATAPVTISQVYLIGGSDENGPRYTIFDTEHTYDLVALQGGVNADLGTVTIPAGTYTQMRFVVTDASVTLDDGTAFEHLRVPSGTQTGIKVTFTSPLQISGGDQKVLIADMNISKNFVFTGPPTAPTGAIFTPVIQATTEATGSISGTVTTGDLTKVTVFAVLNSDTVARANPNTTSGVYLLPFLAAAQYEVGAMNTTNTPGSLIGATKSVTVGAGQSVTGIDFP
jgi:hypothetical protein